jgi:hypothetical protein
MNSMEIEQSGLVEVLQQLTLHELAKKNLNLV